MDRRQKVLVIVGPTASGKSALAVGLAKKFNGEIVSADSRQVYTGLDIGTGKVTEREAQSVPHYLLDIASPKRTVTAHEYSEKARSAIHGIAARGSLPIVVGGTGFYIDALLGRVDLPDVVPNRALRKKLEKKTVGQLYTLLKGRDPNRAKIMNTPSERNNTVRLIRALEVATFKKNSNKNESKGSPWNAVLWIGIAPTKKDLESRIKQRLRDRIRAGMVAEGRRLHAQGLSYKRMEQLGLEYRSLSRLLQRKITRKEFEEELFRDIRRYAKKQTAYWKRNKEIRWFSSARSPQILQTVSRWLGGREAR
ncbi:MAG TPA: tRNA (adenosine(37)-N6)-dimethylallyltransferase MiaA [Candidatus Paceibacterota bacterium]|jgi:tRNA dimethylallyltransferase|nr:tRNA (adenosine(37)-N6)-dimethylallyltransferase MiaA [Candidatus Paceibacterota bacterium]